ncbi:MAG: hypothetical protein A3C43_02860 [Candidatus Schekmanbacteria bacterium RIFCSPHIGHO2_02_FULL_38_11]|uniref:DUF3047 domain-containing protein n=1 Tax=Candidatus Schekmanbacteria bacterium RIFCSPLOWO2_12_FULL_38_15 TaxID=1817883 RepID=A0A1F7SKH3_9BACT|nr:MAG: hypothetical protein A2043_01610 [Candidatus Schekmanbacteria bacterium GWA2_38_9]OGL47917.1 MAG: hypothetical protein A3C43_02860 [Candidatus Schekmanbacteria bacterium RIFCSPHIGHO2_02_FULL_38_11]OGL49283.1 MAG: hypothetical protein A3H37_04910 [Candidatus Schekmanbacteria bacterium RIFCSPLOWO2_02_FULL_38_14]OGL53738.1 MAG: hypothetical protein A3G31_03265 [Candidatus Schekmanbacteria bacterium RIFCSPLOWO2_12_FULL_38_15]
MNKLSKSFLIVIFSTIYLFLLTSYSPIVPSLTPSSIIIDNFSKTISKNVIPPGWEAKENEGKVDCSIAKHETGNLVFHIKSKGTSVGIYKTLEIDIKQYPYFSWKWKVSKLPPNGDVRSKSTDDQAGNIYLVFPGGFPEQLRSKIISYLWESNAPKGLMTTSPKRGNTKNVVVESGKEKLGEWITEKRNVCEDYKKLFNEEPVKTVKICIWIDSDDTESEAEAFYDDLMFSKN